MNTPSDPTFSTKGVACMVGGGFLLTLSDAVLKWLTAGYPVGEVIFLRSIFVFPPIMLFVWKSGGIAVLGIRSLRAQGLRALAAVGSTFFFVTGLSLMPLADIIAITFAGPLFITALAPPFLGEKVGWRRWTAVVVGLTGVLLITRPGPATLHWGAVVALAATFSGVVRDLVTRRITVTESTPAILCVTTVAVTLGGLATLPFGWTMPTAMDIGRWALAGCLFAGAHYLVIEAFRLAEAALVAPFKYFNLIWAVLFGFLIWGNLPDRWVLSGAVLVIASGLYILHRERRRR